MNDKIKVITAFAYDDVRYEAHGGMSFMGTVTDGQFEFADFPVRTRLGISIICDISQTGEATLFPKLRYNGEIKWAIELDVELDAESTGVILPICHTYASFEEPGSLELLLGVDTDEESDLAVVKTWNVFKYSGD
ncbi:hypothetical protein ACWIDJ_11885 [Brevundimonas naejangsanensis]